MTDLATIAATFSTIKNSLDIAKTLKNIDSTYEQGTFKLEIIKLIDLLENAQDSVSDLKQLIQEKDKKIKELEETLKFKSSLIRQNKMYYEIDKEGNSFGEPYCPKCWEVDKIPAHLLKIKDDYFRCANCKNFFGNPPQEPSQIYN